MKTPEGEISIRKGSVLLDQGRYREAVSVFQDGLSRDPENDHLLYFLSLAQYHLEDQRSTALETIDQAIRYDPHRPGYYQLKALILVDTKKPKEALEVIDTALGLDAAYAPAHAAKAYIYSRMEQWASAESSARDALEINAENQFAGNILAHALRMQNKLDESAQLASDLLARDPDDSVSHSSAGWVHLHRRDYQQAQVHFREALRLDPNFEPARAGMLEAFKSRSPMYRLYLRYAMFMSRQSKTNRIYWILGIYLVYRFVIKGARGLMDGPYAILGYLIVFLMIGFVFWTWLANGVGNLFVLCDPYARYSLRRRERWDAITVGGFFVGGLALGVLGYGVSYLPLCVIAVAMMLSAIPFAVTFLNDHPLGKKIFGGIGCYLLLAGMVLAGGVHFYGEEIPGYMLIISAVGFFLFVATTWLAAFGILRE